ncbi:hypothetical protein HTZ77_07490 [Nonomuraea sp. SMC257]|uniref:Uncharacterized protein n=1 Tax=Nonomuraea montanisoli TaxID=2741721 RepID=A0A7Y6M2K7_9ACTN|nr:hypothetical protein [Nonomuraea montanisoli]NUW31264.1 hypothetical protein [Nonomuraea montanisoli]
MINLLTENFFLAPLDPVPLFIDAAEELERSRRLNPKVEEAASLLGGRFGELAEKDLSDLILPTLWASTRNLPICPPPRPSWPPAQPSATAIDGLLRGGYVPDETGMDLLAAAESLLATAFSVESLQRLSNEVAAWSRSRDDNGLRLERLRQETFELQEGVVKVNPERGGGACVGAAVVVGAVFAAGFAAGYAMGKRAK